MDEALFASTLHIDQIENLHVNVQSFAYPTSYLHLLLREITYPDLSKSVNRGAKKFFC